MSRTGIITIYLVLRLVVGSGFLNIYPGELPVPCLVSDLPDYSGVNTAAFQLIGFSRRIATLINNTHVGNTSGIHRMIPMLNKSTAPNPYPRNAIQRGTIKVRRRIVAVESMKTPAILIPYTFMV